MKNIGSGQHLYFFAWNIDMDFFCVRICHPDDGSDCQIIADHINN